MAKGTNQKLKLLYLLKIFLEKTDEEHSLTMSEILEALKGYDVPAERKSIYDDIEALRLYGVDIVGESGGRNYYYHIGNRQFELAELKLLVDSVQAAKFITEKKSRQLIGKLEKLASEHEARQLQRQVYVSGRVKTSNESVFYNVDQIHAAINANVKIRFQYFQWTVKKERKLKRGGAFYCISPWALSWDDENYYLVGFDSEAGQIKHYRVDKMLKLELTDECREGKESFHQFDMASYARKRFGMFNGREENVHLICANHLAGVIIDRFGKNVALFPKDEEHFEVIVQVAVSRQFLGWIIALGDDVKVTAPDSLVEQMKEEIRRLTREYIE